VSRRNPATSQEPGPRARKSPTVASTSRGPNLTARPPHATGFRGVLRFQAARAQLRRVPDGISDRHRCLPSRGSGPCPHVVVARSFLVPYIGEVGGGPYTGRIVEAWRNRFSADKAPCAHPSCCCSMSDILLFEESNPACRDYWTGGFDLLAVGLTLPIDGLSFGSVDLGPSAAK